MKTDSLMTSSSEELYFALERKLKSEGKTTAAKIISVVANSTTEEQENLLLKISTDDKNTFSCDEALHQMIYLQLSKEKYNFLRQEHLKNNHEVYPSYKNLLNAKKMCYPENILVKKNKITIQLQDLVDHTANRLYEVIKN